MYVPNTKEGLPKILNTRAIWPYFLLSPKFSKLNLHMPKLNGLFDSFDNLDSIDINSLVPWLKNLPVTTSQLENYLGNKILYPETLPLTESDMKIDLAILREALRMMGDNLFLNTTLRKIIIPKRFLHFVPDLVSLTWAFVDGLLLNRKKRDQFEDLWTVVVTDDMDEIVGSILIPQFGNSQDTMNLSLDGRNYERSSKPAVYKVVAGSLILIKCPKSKSEITYKFITGKVLGKNAGSVEISGGKLGLMIDGRVI